MKNIHYFTLVLICCMINCYGMEKKGTLSGKIERLIESSEEFKQTSHETHQKAKKEAQEHEEQKNGVLNTLVGFYNRLRSNDSSQNPRQPTLLPDDFTTQYVLLHGTPEQQARVQEQNETLARLSEQADIIKQKVYGAPRKNNGTPEQQSRAQEPNKTIARPSTQADTVKQKVYEPSRKNKRKKQSKREKLFAYKFRDDLEETGQELEEIVKKPDDLSASSKQFLWQAKKPSGFAQCTNKITYSTIRSLLGLVGCSTTLYVGIKGLLPTRSLNYSALAFGTLGSGVMLYDLYHAVIK